MSTLYNTILYQPLFNTLVFLYGSVAFRDLGVAIILLTILIRIVLYPLFHKSTKNQMAMQALQPEIQKLQKLHKEDREKQTKAIMDLYREREVNPFSGIILLFVQLPILIALYQVFFHGFSDQTFLNLYSFVPHPATVNDVFLGLINLKERSIVMVGLAALTQFWQAKLLLPKRNDGEAPSAQERMGRQMVYLGPILTLVVLFNLPAAVGVYWITTTLFSVAQQLLIKRTLDNSGRERRMDA